MHILRKIENREIAWFTEWQRFEHHIYERVVPTVKSEKTRKTVQSGVEYMFFCKAFQKPEGCLHEVPHPGKIGTGYKTVHHFCATCWQKDRSKNAHSESSLECPFKQA